MYKNLLEEFKKYLLSQGFGKNSIRSYCNDIAKFLLYVRENFPQLTIQEILDQNTTEKYITKLKKNKIPESTLRRYKASVKRFSLWQKQILPPPVRTSTAIQKQSSLLSAVFGYFALVPLFIHTHIRKNPFLYGAFIFLFAVSAGLVFALRTLSFQSTNQVSFTPAYNNNRKSEIGARSSEINNNQPITDYRLPITDSLSPKNILGVRTSKNLLQFNVDTQVNGLLEAIQGMNTYGADVDLREGKLTASNVVYNLIAGQGILVGPGQTPTITNTDPGSAQQFFSSIAVGGNTITANQNKDTLSLKAGSNISLSTTGKEITITSTATSGTTYNDWLFAVDGTTYDTVASGDTMNFNSGTDFDVTRSADDTLQFSLEPVLDSVTTLNLPAGGSVNGTNATINFDNFDVSSAGGITIASGQTITIGTTGFNETANGDSGSELIGVYTGGFTNTSPSSSDLQTVLETFDTAIGSGSSKWTISSNVLHPTTLTDDLAIGSSTISTAPFAVDVNANTIYVGDNTTAGNTSVIFKSNSGANTGSLLYNSSDQFEFSGGNVKIDGQLIAGSGSESITLASGKIDADALTLITSAGTGITASYSGLETISDGIGLLQGCSNGEILKWNDSSSKWECAGDSGASFAVINVQNNDAGVGTSVDTIDFSLDFLLTASPTNEVNISLNPAVAGTGLTLVSNSLSINTSDGITTSGDNIVLNPTSAGNGLTYASGILSVGAGNGISVTGDTVLVSLLSSTAGTGVTASYSGLEFSNGALTMLQGCGNNELLQWNDTLARWECKSVSGVGAVSGTGTSNYVPLWNGTSSLTNSLLYQTGSFLGVGRTDPGYALDVLGTIQGQNLRLTNLSSGTAPTLLSILGNDVQTVDTSSWDKDTSNDLTTSTNFLGDVSGLYNNLQIGTSVVGGTELASTGVGASTYGGATAIPVLTVDEDGRITAASNQSISFDNYQYWTAAGNVGSTNIPSTGTLTIAGSGAGIATSVVGGSLNIYNTGDTSNTNELQNLWLTIAGNAGSTTANSQTDTLTLSGASGIATSVVGDTVSFYNTGVLSLTGTLNQVYVNGGTGPATGAITLTLPQSIGTSSTPTFGGLTLTNLSTAGLVTNTAGGTLGTTTGTNGYFPFWINNTLSGTSPFYTDGSYVTIGSTASLGKFAIDGNADQIQFVVQGNSAQTNNLATFENSAGDDLLQITNYGDLLAGFTQLDGSTTTNGTGASSTSLVVTSVTNFEAGNYIKLVNSSNCSGTRSTCFAKINSVNVGANTLNLSNPMSWANGQSITEWHVPEIGGTNSTNPTNLSRFGAIYSIPGLVTGNGTTYYFDGSIFTADITGGNSQGFSILTGNTTTSGNSGNISIDTGTAAGTAGSINIGTSNAPSIQIGHSGASTIIGGTLVVDGQAFSHLTGNGLDLIGGELSVNLLSSTAGTGVTASVSGLEFSSGSLTMLQGCSDGELLQWNESTATWRCQSVSGTGAVDGTGATNYIALWNDSNSLTYDANQFYWDAGADRLGIGTTAPSVALDVQGQIQAGSSNITLTTAAGYIDADAIGLTSAGTGATASSSGLEVVSDSLGLLQGCSDGQILSWDNTNNIWRCTTASGIGGVGDITAVGNVTNGEAFTTGTPGSALYFANNGYLGIGTTGPQVLFDSSNNDISLLNGKVGIGLSNPSYDLTVEGSIQADNYYSSDGTSGGSITTGGLTFKNGLYTTGTAASGVSGTGTSNYVPLWNGTSSLTNSLLYQTGGYIGIGITNPNDLLDVAGVIDTSEYYQLDDITILNQVNTGSLLLGHYAGVSLPAGADYNLIAGYEAGRNMSGDVDYTIALGYQAGYNNDGDNNYFAGYQAGYFNTTGIDNFFAGFQAGKGTSQYTGSDYNIAIGRGSLSNIASNLDSNIALGINTGAYNTDGDNNFFAGYYAGRGNSLYTGSVNNTVIGYQAMINIGSNASDNVVIGNQAGQYNVDGDNNFYAGYFAGAGTSLHTGSSGNVAIGQFALANIGSNAVNNTVIGQLAGRYNFDGDHNLFMGYYTGIGTTEYSGSDYNIFLGYQSGYNISSNQDRNILLGYQAGYNVTGSDKLYIESSSAGPTGALIYGDFASDLLTVNGKLGIGTTNPGIYELMVEGDIQADNYYSSDGTSGESTTTGGLTFKNGLYTAGTAAGGTVTGTGTDNYLARFNAAGTGIENGTLVDNSTTGISLNISSTNNVGIGGTATATAPSLYIGANGNIGIATTNPTNLLHMVQVGSTAVPLFIDASASSLNFNPGLLVSLPASGQRKAIQARIGSDEDAWASIEWNAGGTDKPGIAFGPGGSIDRDVNVYREGTAILGIGSTAYFASLVGIGTTTPGSYELMVEGDIQADNYFAGSGSQGSTTTVSGLTFEDGLYISGTVSASGVGGTGIANYISKWNDATNLTISQLYDTGTYVGIGVTNPNDLLEVAGVIDTSEYYELDDITVLNQINTGTFLIGSYAGVSLPAGADYNTFTGYEAGRLSTNTAVDFNTVVGYQAGYYNQNASNVFIGASAGKGTSIYTGSDNNVIVGVSAGERIGNSSDGNVYVGSAAGYYNQNGLYNVMIGMQTGYGPGSNYNSSNSNVFLGHQAGYLIGSSQDRNILLGYQAGYNVTGSDKLYIESSSAGPTGALIYGDFASDLLTVNGKLGIGTTNPGIYELMVEGDIQADNYYSSDGTSGGSITTGGLTFKNGLYTEGTASSGVGGSGTANYLSMWSNSSTLTNSLLYQTGNNIGIGLTNPSFNLHVAGTFGVGSTAYFGSLVGIGTSTPDDALDVAGVIDTNSSYELNNITVMNVLNSNTLLLGHYAGVSLPAGANNNVFIGYEAGRYASGGLIDDTVIIGSTAGKFNQGGSSVLIGTAAGYNNSGSFDVIIGDYAGYNNQANYNLFFGRDAGYYNTNGGNNIVFGQNAGKGGSLYSTSINNVSIGQSAHQFVGSASQYNTSIGTQTGQYNVDGDFNTFIGFNAGKGITSYTGSDSNIGIGSSSLASLGSNADYNIALGYQSGGQLTTGDRNILLGYFAGYGVTSENDQLYIDSNSSPASSAFIWGDMANDILALNSKVGIGTTAPGIYELMVEGDIQADNYYSSDGTSGGSTTTGGLTFKNGLYTAGTAAGIGGTGTTGYLSKWSNSTTLTNSLLYETATGIGLGTTAPGSYELMVEGDIQADNYFAESGSQGSTTTVSGLTFEDGLYITGSVLGSGVGGSGVANYISKWSDPSNLTNSRLYDNGSGIGIGTTAPGIYELMVEGDIQADNYYSSDGTSGGSTTTGGLTFKNGLYTGGTATGGASEWNDTGTYLYPIDFSEDNVGIGGSTLASAAIYLGVNGSAIFNDQGSDADFRIEGDNNSNLFFVDASTDRIGIATSAPAALLDVVGTTWLHSGVGQSGLYVNASGKVGIGLTNPSTSFEVLVGGGTDVVTYTTFANLAGTLSTIEEFKYNNGASTIGRIGLQSVAGTGTFVLTGATSRNLGLATNSNSVPQVLLNTSGYLGVGTTNPTYMLDVNGTLGVGSTSYFASLVGIGTTNPLGQLHVVTPVGGNGALFEMTGNGTYSPIRIYNANTTDNTSAAGISFRSDTTGGGATTNAEFSNIRSRVTVHDNATKSSVLEFFTSDNGTVTNQMYIGSDGNIGIGTTAPGTYELMVEGDIQADNYYSSDGTSGGSTTTGGLTFKNGLYTSGTITGGSSEWTDTGSFLTPNEFAADNIAIGGSTLATSTIYLGVDGSALFNEQGSAVDFRIQGDNNPNLFFVDGSADMIGIGVSNPNDILEVAGVIDTSEYYQLDDVTILNQVNTGSLLLGHYAGVSLPAAADGNTLLGYEAGRNMSGDVDYTIALGYQAGYNNDGDNNYFAGYQAGYFNTTGTDNFFAGYQAGRGTSQYQVSNNNIAMGNSALYSIAADAVSNISLGYQAGYRLTSGDNNFFAGEQAGYYNTNGTNNYFVGYNAGFGTSVYSGSDNNIAIGNNALFGIGNNADQNIALGNAAGYNNATGLYNFFAGYYAGEGVSTYGAHYNVAIGYQAQRYTTTGASYNVSLGAYAGLNNYNSSYNNVFIGRGAGSGTSLYTNSTDNIGIGTSALGALGGTSLRNTAIGSNAGFYNYSGDNNIYIGTDAGLNNFSGQSNVFIGFEAGKGSSVYSLNDFNIIIGYQAGYNIADVDTANKNILIGYQAGYNMAGTDQLYIDSNSSPASSAFIWGDMANDKLALNANVGIGTTNPTYKLQVEGDIKVANAELMVLGSNSGAPTGGENGAMYYDVGTSKFRCYQAGAWTDCIGSAGGFDTAGNGLTAAGTTVKLGGNLTENTTITQDSAESLTFTNNGSANLVVNLASSGDFVIQNEGTPFVTFDDAGATTFNGSGAVAFNAGSITSTGVLTIDATSAVVLGTGTNGLRVDETWSDSTSGYTGSARPTQTIVLSPEYAGSVLTTFYGAGTDTNITGNMTSDGETAPATTIKTYYEWKRTSSTLHYYTVAVRVTLPKDFGAWDTNAVVVNYKTNDSSTSNNTFNAYIYQEGQASQDWQSNSGTALANTSWSTVTASSSDLDLWNAAGETAVIYLRLGSQSSNWSRIGDITLQYKAKF
jgi:hypothetical protein